MKSKKSIKSFTYTQYIKGDVFSRKFVVSFIQKNPVTFCKIYLQNNVSCNYDFFVSSKTVCRVPDVFDSEKGKRIVFEKVIEKLATKLNKIRNKEYVTIGIANKKLDSGLENKFESFIKKGK